MIVVTGYYSSQGSMAQFNRWCNNTKQYGERYVISALASNPFPIKDIQWIRLSGNVGHNGKGNQQGVLSGWTHSFLTGCLLAYGCQQDMLYQEGDCLAFGNYLTRLYKEIGPKGLISGKTNTSGNSIGGDARGFPAQSLVLVRHWYLLNFVKQYLSIPESDTALAPEHKFTAIGASYGQRAITTMGYDRSRPINYDDPEFYAQQLSGPELEELRKRGLI